MPKTFSIPKIFIKIGGSVWGIKKPDGSAPDMLGQMADQIAELSQNAVVTVVVSAFKGETDKLIAEANTCWPLGEKSTAQERSARAHFIAQGENEAQSLLTKALQERKVNAAGFTGAQVFATEGDIENADIRFFESGYPVYDFMQQSVQHTSAVAVVAGFSGYNEFDKHHTIFGRGGSDRSLMGLLVRFNAAEGEIPGQIVRNEGGVFTADPKMVDRPLPHKNLTTGELLAMTKAGGGRSLIQLEAAHLAHAQGIPLIIGPLNDRDNITRIDYGPANPRTRVLAVATSDAKEKHAVSIVGWNIANQHNTALQTVEQAIEANPNDLKSRLEKLPFPRTPQILTIELPERSDQALIRKAVNALHARFIA